MLYFENKSKWKLWKLPILIKAILQFCQFQKIAILEIVYFRKLQFWKLSILWRHKISSGILYENFHMNWWLYAWDFPWFLIKTIISNHSSKWWKLITNHKYCAIWDIPYGTDYVQLTGTAKKNFICFLYFLDTFRHGVEPGTSSTSRSDFRC